MIFRFTYLRLRNRLFDRVDRWINFRIVKLGGFLSLTRAGLGFTRFPCGNRFAVIRTGAGLNHHLFGGVGIFLTYARQRRLDSILIFRCRLHRSLFVTCLSRLFFTLKTSLTGFKTGFCLRSTFLFHRNGINFSLLDAEILHQRNITWADPGARAALNAVGQVVRFGFIVQLPFAVPVELLGQQIRRTSIGTGAATDTAFLFLLLAHLAD